MIEVISSGGVEVAKIDVPAEEAMAPGATDKGEVEEVVEEVPADLWMTALPSHADQLREMEGRHHRLLTGVKLDLQIPQTFLYSLSLVLTLLSVIGIRTFGGLHRRQPSGVEEQEPEPSFAGSCGLGLCSRPPHNINSVMGWHI